MRTGKHQICILNLSLASWIHIFFYYLLYYSFLGTSTLSLCLEITKEEAELTETGTDQPHDMTLALLIQNGLDLEEQQ